MSIIELNQMGKIISSVFVVCEHITGFFEVETLGGKATRIYTTGVSSSGNGFVDVTETPEQIIALIARVMPIDLTS